MKGQMGVGTIIIFIAGILVAVVAAILFLQVTNNLRGQAILTNRQAQETMANRFEIDRVEGVSFLDKNAGEYRVRYLVLRIRPGMGAESLNLKTTILTYSDGEVTIPAAKYVSVRDTLVANKQDANWVEGNVNDACDAKLFNLMEHYGKYSYHEIVPILAPTFDGDINKPDYSRFTVVWEECADKGDLYSLSDGQTAYLIYAPKIPLASGTYITIDLHLAEGWSSPMKLRIPAGLDRGYVVIYPTS